MSGNIPLSKANGIMACELDEGLAILHQASGTFFVLGEIESFIWNRLTDPTTGDEVAAAVGETYDAPQDEIDRDVRKFLKSMIDADLITCHDQARA